MNSFSSIPIEDRAKAKSLTLRKRSLSNYLGCVTQEQLPKRTWEISSLRTAEQRVSAGGCVRSSQPSGSQARLWARLAVRRRRPPPRLAPGSVSWPGSSSLPFHSVLLGNVIQSQMGELDS